MTKLERDANGWVVNGWIRTRLLIGAGGHGCPVAHVLGGHPKAPPIAAMVAEFADGEDAAAVAAGSVSISFTPDLAGYGWLLRKGKFLNVGLGSLHGTKVRRQAQEYCRELKLRGLLPEDVTPRLKGHAYLPYRRHGGRRLFSERALLIGDAAGVSSPMSGEGILPSVETAIMAAQTVVAAAGDYRLETLAPYAAAVAARFGGGSGDGRDVPQQVRRLVGTALLSSRYLTRRLVLDRWFLHAGQRALDAEVETPVQWMVSEMED